MPPEPLPFGSKDFFKERKPSSSDPAGVVPVQWREPPTTPSSHPNNHGFFSYRWGGGGGSSDFRRPISGHGKQVGGGWHVKTVESLSLDDKSCRNGSVVENNHCNSLAVPSSSLKDRKGGNSWETTVSPNGSSHPHPDFVNSWDQHQSKDQHDKSNGGGVSTTGGQRLENENSLGSSIDWKPLKWIRSGSLSSRGSGFSHSSSSKSIGVDSHDIKIDSQAGNNTPVQSPSGDAIPCLTPRTADEVSSRKKPRLGWGEGLAKYEKKKVGPDDVDKSVQARNGMVDGVSSSELLLPSPASMPDKSPSLTGCSDCASPATPYSFACSSSPGVEEKAAVADNDICNSGVPSCHPSNSHTEGSIFNLESLELTEGFNLTSKLDELLQCNSTRAPDSGFVRCNAMDKLQVWKADISRTLEVTESEIDSLENELKLLISDVGASCSLAKECNDNKNTDEKSEVLAFSVISSGDTPIDGSVERTGVKDLDIESSGKTSDLVDVRSENVEEAKCSEDNVNNDILNVPESSIEPVGGDVRSSEVDKLCESIMASNKVFANEASDKFRSLLPITECSIIPRVSNESIVKKKVAMRKRFLKFKERIVTLKFRAFQYLWKEDLRLQSVRRSGSKSLKKFELGYADHQKSRPSLKYRICSAGNSNQDRTTEVVGYLNKLLSDSRVRTYRNVLKMPSFILDKRERTTSRFISDNRLVENPIDVEKERSLINPWTSEEKEIFLDKYSLFGKDFKKIASFLEHKTIADCVEFYYKNHKSENFQKTKKNSVFAKDKPSTASTYLVTSGRRLNQQSGSASLEILAASAMAANGDHKLLPPPFRDDVIIPESRFCNEQETAAADVLAGICGSISSEALGSCITSSGDVHHHQVSRRCQKSLNDVDEETWSDDSCGEGEEEEEMESFDWTDEEKSSFIKAVRVYGKDFTMISRFIRTRSIDQCKVFFSKSRKCLGLDSILLEGNRDIGNDHDHDRHEHEDAFMVNSGSVISHDKSSPEEGKTDLEDPQEEQDAESDQKVVNNGYELDSKPEERRSSNGDLEGAADSEALNVEEAPQLCVGDMNSSSAKPSEHQLTGILTGSSSCHIEDLNSDSHFSLDLSTTDHGSILKSNPSDNGFLVSGLFPQEDNNNPTNNRKKTVISHDDVSMPSRLSFRKSGSSQKSWSTDGYHLHLPKHSLLDCAESSQILNGYPVRSDERSEPKTKFNLDLMDPCYPGLVSSSPDVEKPMSRSRDVKLFGQILTKCSSNQPPESDPIGGSGSGRSFDFKFDNNHHTGDRRSASLDLDRNNNHHQSFRHIDNNNVSLRSFGFWDGNRIQTGFSSLPDSAMLRAKYPAAFSNAYMDQHPHQLHSFLKSGGGGNDHHHQHQHSTHGSLGRRLSRSGGRDHNGYGKVVVEEDQGGINGGMVSDPVAAIRMHYANFKSGSINGGRRH